MMEQAESRTYESWKYLGYHVIFGEKAAFFRDGVAYFTEEQVEEDFDDYEDVSGGA